MKPCLVFILPFFFLASLSHVTKTSECEYTLLQSMSPKPEDGGQTPKNAKETLADLSSKEKEKMAYLAAMRDLRNTSPKFATSLPRNRKKKR